MNMQAAPLCRGYTPREQDAADTLVSNRAPAKIEVRSCALGTKGPRPVQPDGDLALDARLGMHGLPVRLVFDLRRACEHGTVAAVGAYGP